MLGVGKRLIGIGFFAGFGRGVGRASQRKTALVAVTQHLNHVFGWNNRKIARSLIVRNLSFALFGVTFWSIITIRRDVTPLWCGKFRFCM